MLINQLSCVVSMVVAYILSYNRINKRRIIILAAVAVVNMIANAFFYGDINLTTRTIDWIKILISLGITIAGIISIVITNLVFKSFGRKKLNKKIIAFTKKANPNLDLKMMTGDLTFFGEFDNMENNPQLMQLIKLNFKNIKIITKSPVNNKEKIKIGKLFHLLNESSLEIKFYDPDSYPDLRLRFRYISLGNGSTAILNVFKFVAEKEYSIEELGFSSDSVQKKRHETFEKLWNMYWNALIINEKIINECKAKYNEFITVRN